MDTKNIYKATVCKKGQNRATSKTFEVGHDATSFAGKAFQQGAQWVRVMKNPNSTDPRMILYMDMGQPRSNWVFPQKQG